VKELLPIVTAGGAFCGGSLIGLGLGIVLAGRFGSQLWVLGGLFAGMAAGGYSAVRLLLRSQ
jgi:hypothetical protein